MSVMKIGALALAALTLSACATYVDGGRASDTAQGIEYSLPVPIVRVTPQPNGTMTVDVDYLPDPDNTYMLRTRSIVSSYTLDVQRENGILKSVSLDSKADAVAAAVAESAGNVIKARSDKLTKEQDAADAAAKEQAKALADAQLAVLVAQAKLDALNNGGAAADKKLEAQLALAEASAKLNFLKGQAANSGNSFNAPVQDALVAAGPVLFRVVPVGRDNVKLVAFEGPTFFATSLAAKPQTAPAAATNYAVLLQGSGVLVYQPNQALTLTLKATPAVRGLDLGLSTLTLIGGGPANRIQLVDHVNVNPTDSGTSIYVTLRANTPRGRYRLEPVLTTTDHQPTLVNGVVDFTVRR